MREREDQSKLLAKLIVVCVITTMVYIMTVGQDFSFANNMIFVIIYGGYCTLGYYLNIEPDYDNMGYFGGLMNNPFKISDNFNRTLLFFKVLFWPGKAIGATVVEAVTYIRDNS